MKSMQNLKQQVWSIAGNFCYIIRIMVKTAPLFLLLTLVFAVLSGFANVIQSYYLSKIIDGILANIPYVTISIYAVCIIAFQLLQKIQTRTLYAMNRVVTEKISFTMEERILSLAEKISLAKMDEPGFLNRMEQARGLTKQTPTSVFMILFGMFSLLAGTVGYIFVLGKISFLYVVILIACSVMLFIANHQYEENVVSALFTMSPERRKMGYYSSLLTGRNNFEEIRTYRASPFFLGKYKASAEKQMKESWRIFKRFSGLYVIAALVAYLGCGIVYLLIIWNTVSGKTTLGDMAMFLTACLGFQAGLIELTDGLCSLPPQLAIMQNYRSLLNELEEDVNNAAKVPMNTDTEHLVNVNNLTFAYPNTEKNILNGVTFSINQGECVALVGENGAGKTTLVRLLAGFYSDYQGIIQFPFEENPASILFQNYLHPSLTIGEAVALENISDKNESRILDALNKARFPLDNLPQGIHTELTKTFDGNGTIPSGGQWQRLALARMFYRDMPMFILDEPSAALDPKAEDDIFRLLESMKGEHTILFITHRLASVSIADRVLFLSPEGKLTQGTHHALMEECEPYRNLYQMQASKYLMEGNTDHVGDSVS